VNGDVLAPQTPSQCGNATSIGSNPVACTTDSNGKVTVIYTAPSTAPPAHPQNITSVVRLTAA